MRVRRTQSGITTRYLYDGDDLVAEVDSAGNRIRTYRYWPGIDQPHSMQSWESGQNGTVYYYVLDLPSNTVKGLVTSAGTVTHRYSYGPFGEPQGTSGTVGNPLRFAARELDATTGLYYFRARWYDPSMGRFLSEDPIGLAGGVNNYAYALNDPVNLSDPTGLCPVVGSSSSNPCYLDGDGLVVSTGTGPNTGFSSFLFRSRGASLGAMASFAQPSADCNVDGAWPIECQIEAANEMLAAADAAEAECRALRREMRTEFALDAFVVGIAVVTGGGTILGGAITVTRVVGGALVGAGAGGGAQLGRWLTRGGSMIPFVDGFRLKRAANAACGRAEMLRNNAW